MTSPQTTSAPCQCCGFTDKCHGWRDRVCAGTCRLPGCGPPPAHPCPAAAGAARARLGVTQRHWPWCARWDEQTEQSWSGTQQGSTSIGEDGGRGRCRVRWHCPACCPGPAVSYMHRPQEPCILHPPMGARASHRLDHQSTCAGAKTRKCVCACVTLAACPRGCVTAPGVSIAMCETACSMSAVCVHIPVCVCVPVQPPRSGWAAGRMRVCQAWGAGMCPPAQRARRRLQSEAGWQQPLPQASAPRLSSYISWRRGPRSRGSSNEMEQQKDGEIRLPALPQQIKRWD